MVKLGKMKGAGGVLVVVGMYVVWFGGCDRTPTSPAPKTGTDYVAYFADLNSEDLVFGYHILSGQLDSFQVPALPEQGMAVSPDGERLYLAMNDSALAVNIGDPQNAIVLPYDAEGGVSVSPDNRYVALLGPGGVNILRVADYSLFHHDTGWAFNGRFSTDGNAFYCVTRENVVYCAKLGPTVTVTRMPRPWHWNAVYVIPSPDESRRYVYAAYSACSWGIEVNDVAGDSLLTRHMFEPGMGEMEMTPDGRLLVYTNPDADITYCFAGDASFTVYDPLTNTSSPIQVVPDSVDRDIYHDFPYFVFESVEVTPDGRWIVAGDGDVIALVNALTLEIEKYEIIPGQKRLTGLSIPGAL